MRVPPLPPAFPTTLLKTVTEPGNYQVFFDWTSNKLGGGIPEILLQGSGGGGPATLVTTLGTVEHVVDC